MALAGDGFLAMWHDIASEAEEEYNLWHTQEHMPERVGIPGFKVARRYVDWNLELHRYFTLYEGQAIETFDSPDYIARLNAPTSWTQKMMPAFRNMVRGACRTVATVGTGIGAPWQLYALVLRMVLPRACRRWPRAWSVMCSPSEG